MTETAVRCRFCDARLTFTFVDLGAMPLANAFLTADQVNGEEPRYPLHARVCGECFLVQVASVVSPEDIFREYAYFSSYSSSWVEHARRYAERARDRLVLTADSLVVEIASNDGYLLRHFRRLGVPVLGIEPAENVAKVAVDAGIPTETSFFGLATADDLLARGRAADLLVANNVFAHVPDLNDFVAGMVRVLKPAGVISIEVPHLLRLIESVQFDTIYHEHFSYFSLATAERVLGAHGLQVFDVEQLPTHGGSLRLWVGHARAGRQPSAPMLEVRTAERRAGLDDIGVYTDFAATVEECRRSMQAFLSEAKSAGSTIVGYGAAAKGNTLLNFCNVSSDDIAFVVDRSPHKQGLFLPGTHLPIHDPSKVREARPEYLLVLPWNLLPEIRGQMSHIREWGGRFVTPIPRIEVHP